MTQLEVKFMQQCWWENSRCDFSSIVGPLVKLFQKVNWIQTRPFKRRVGFDCVQWTVPCNPQWKCSLIIKNLPNRKWYQLTLVIVAANNFRCLLKSIVKEVNQDPLPIFFSPSSQSREYSCLDKGRNCKYNGNVFQGEGCLEGELQLEVVSMDKWYAYLGEKHY